MSHHHGSVEKHDHSHHSHTNRKALFIAFLMIFGFMIIEAVGGVLTNSLALLSDAGHMLSDAGALALSLLAMWFASRPPSASKTFGYHRFEILAALINGVTLVLISIYIFWEAFKRFQQPPTVASGGMITIATIGLIVNITAAFILMKGDTHGNLNMRSAFLHVIGDLLGSIGAIAAGTVMLLFQWYWADPVISAVIAALILISAWRVTSDSVHVLMEGTPKNVSLHRLNQSLLNLSGVKEVHDLHVWTVTSGFLSLSCHLVVDGTADNQQVLRTAKHMLQDKFGIEHSTLQLEDGRLCEGDEICERRGEA